MPLQDANPTPSFGGFGLIQGDALGRGYRMTSRALRASYRRYDVKGRTVEQWRALFEEMARSLPVHRVPASRLIPEDNCRLDSATLQARVDDVENDRSDNWMPLVVEGLPPPFTGPLRVVDGNHRAHAALAKPGLQLDVVIAREKL